jgi:hypothetical protein
MSNHELHYCPSCQNSFECRVGNITQCQCFDIELTELQKEWVQNQFDDCLCAACLLKIKEGRGFDGKYASSSSKLD